MKVLVKPSKTVVKLLQLSNRLILVLKKASLLQSSDRPGLGNQLLTLAGGLQTPTTGRVLINQSDYSDLPEKKRAQLRYKDIGFVLQASNLIPFLTVEKQLTLVDKVNKKTDPNKHQKLLADLGVAHLKNKFLRICQVENVRG